MSFPHNNIYSCICFLNAFFPLFFSCALFTHQHFSLTKINVERFRLCLLLFYFYYTALQTYLMHCETKDNKSIHIIPRVLKKKRKKKVIMLSFHRPDWSNTQKSNQELRVSVRVLFHSNWVKMLCTIKYSGKTFVWVKCDWEFRYAEITFL